MIPNVRQPIRTPASQAHRAAGPASRASAVRYGPWSRVGGREEGSAGAGVRPLNFPPGIETPDADLCPDTPSSPGTASPPSLGGFQFPLGTHTREASGSVLFCGLPLPLEITFENVRKAWGVGGKAPALHEESQTARTGAARHRVRHGLPLAARVRKEPRSGSAPDCGQPPVSRGSGSVVSRSSRLLPSLPSAATLTNKRSVDLRGPTGAPNGQEGGRDGVGPRLWPGPWIGQGARCQRQTRQEK